MSHSQIRDEIANFIFAAFETTANMLSWTVLCLAQHADVQDACAKEAYHVLKSCDQQTVGTDTLRLMPQLEAACMGQSMLIVISIVCMCSPDLM